MAAPPSYNDAMMGGNKTPYPSGDPAYPPQGGAVNPAFPTGEMGGYGNPQQPGYGYQAGYAPPQAGYAPPQAGQGAPPPIGFAAPPNAGFVPPPPVRFNQPINDSSDVEMESGNEAAFGNSLSDKNIRRAFIRKVYLILTAQLSVTAAFIAIFLFTPGVKGWVRTNSWFYYLSYGTFLVTYIVLVCCPSVRRKTPGNYICLLVFTLAFSYMTATISSFYDTNIVLIAAGITTLVCLSVTIFAMQTKFDFTMCAGILFMASMAFFFFGIACMIVMFTIGYSYILNCVYAGLGALLFSLFLAFDTQMVLGGKKYQLSEEDYVFGAIQLYMDVVMIFLMILSLTGSKK